MNEEKSKSLATANNLASLGLKLILAPIALGFAALVLFVCYVVIRAIFLA